MGTSRRTRLFPESTKYLKIAKHSSLAAVIRTCPVQLQLKPSFCKLLCLLKDFAGVFLRYQVTWPNFHKFDQSKIITLEDVFFFKDFMLFWAKPQTEDPCLNLPEFPDATALLPLVVVRPWRTDLKTLVEHRPPHQMINRSTNSYLPLVFPFSSALNPTNLRRSISPKSSDWLKTPLQPQPEASPGRPNVQPQEFCSHRHRLLPRWLHQPRPWAKIPLEVPPY